MWPLLLKDLMEWAGAKCATEPGPEVLRHEITGVCTDSRRYTQNEIFFALNGENFLGTAFVNDVLGAGAPAVVVPASWEGLKTLSASHSSRVWVCQDTLKALRRLSSRFRRRLSCSVIAIGGSNGKTTSKEMLAALLSGGPWRVEKTQKSENGFIGVPTTLLSRSINVAANPHALVLEIGIDAIGAMSQHMAISRPRLALLTALGPEHLTGLKTLDNCIKEELQLFGIVDGKYNPSLSRAVRIWQLCDEKIAEHIEHACAGDVFVTEKTSFYNDSWAKDVLSSGISILFFEVSTNAQSSEVNIEWHEAPEFEPLKTRFIVPMPARHNALNFALVCATALRLGRTLHEMRVGWAKFQPPPMRSKISRLNNGCILFDDCYNSNPQSLFAALETLNIKEWQEKKKIVVLGDMLDLGSESKYWHSKLVPTLASLKMTHLCLYGKAMYDVYQDLRGTTLSNVIVYHKAPNEDPAGFISLLTGSLSDCIILVKGSRSMDLGRFVDKVTEILGS